MFAPYLHRRNLVPDGEPIVTPNGRLPPVRRHGEPAMLKLAQDEDERFGGRLMEWWDGDPAEVDLRVAELAAAELDR